LEYMAIGRYLPEQPVVNIGTAGHVDHGKTTLVQAITGKWASSHSEELRRGITIKVGYADAAIYACEKCPPPLRYGTSPICNCGNEAKLLRVVSFVDCPGHESLMTNMLSGAAVMDGALLLIAANEPVPQPQTKEHLMALEMLGITNIVVVQNKVDLVTREKAEENYFAIKRFLQGTVAESAPIIPVSAVHGINVDALLEAIERCIPTAERKLDAPPLMQILRSFDVNRPGTKIENLRGGVIGGTLLQGALKLEDEIEIAPGMFKKDKSVYEPIITKVVSLMSSAGPMEQALPRGLVGVGTLLDPCYTKSDALVGNVVSHPGKLPPVLDSFSFIVELFEIVVGLRKAIPVEKIRIGEMLRLNVGTAATVGEVVSVKDNEVQVRLRRPVCTCPGTKVAVGRMITERWRLIGSGVIV